MSPQADFIVSNGTGAAVRSDLNVQFAAIVSNNSGATEPATMYAYQWWADTTAGLLKLRNSANNAWITLRELDGTLLMEDGTAAAPGLSFASDPDSGIFRGGANEFGIATNGVERVEFGTSEVVFNDGGANYDFRIEGDTNTSLFFVDASAEAVGIGTTTPNVTGFGSTVATINVATGSNGGLELTKNNVAAGHFTVEAGASNDVRVGAVGGSAALTFQTGGSERGRFDSSGRLLVGTSATLPVYYNATDVWQGLFQVARSDQQAIANFSIWSNNASTYTAYGGTQIHLSACRSGTVGTHTGGALTNDDTIGSITFNASDGTNFRNSARIEAEVDGGVSTGDVPGRLVFSTTADAASNPTERMRITSSGQTKVFSSSDYTFLAYSVKGANATTDRLFAGIHSATGVNDGTLSFQVWTNGNVQNTNNSYGAISDIKLKENIVDANSQWDDLKALQVRNYNFKDETNYGTHTQIGLVAQEVELVSPGLVSESPDRDEDGNDLGTVTKSVNYSVLYMKAVKALQEAMERIETLEQRLNDAGIN
jgi:hypothetical protein